MIKISPETKRRIKLVLQEGPTAIYHYVISYVTYLSLRKKVQRNKAFMNSAEGKTVFIIGNGPSLKETNWATIKGHDLIIMNNYYKTGYEMDHNIVAHCYGEPSNSPSWETGEVETVINGQIAKSHWLHSSSARLFSNHEKKNTIYYVHSGFEPALSLGRSIRLDRLALSYDTTAQMAIQLALFMGYKRVGLLGLDHDWPFSGSYFKHYYSSEQDKNDHLGKKSMIELLTRYKHMWELYLALAASAKKHKALIYNLNYHSKLDVFDKITLEEFIR